MKGSILVTGSKGFIGKHLLEKLSRLEIIYKEFDGDIKKTESFGHFNNESISRVIHLAGISIVTESWEDPVTYYHNNTFGTLNVLEFCKEKKIPLIFISSYVYGIPDEMLITEETPPKPNNPYAHSKYMAEQMCEFYSASYDIPITVLRPFNVYGKGQSENFVIPHIINQVLNEDKIIIKDLNPKRDYIYVDDVADAIITTLKCEKKYSVYNVASGISHSVKELIEIIQDLARTEKPIISENNTRKNEINNIEVDISKTMKELNWHPSTSIKNGLAEMLRD